MATPEPATSQPTSRKAAPASWLPSQSWRLRAALILLAVVYGRVINFAPVYDDNTLNNADWGGPGNLLRVFTSDIFGAGGTAHSVYYRPLAVSYGILLGYVTGGLPAWSHLASVLLLVAVFGLAYRVGCHLFGDDGLALLVALLFCLHPSRVESTAWIGSSLVDTLAALFFFATMLTFLKSLQTHWVGWRSASVVLCACALLTKETTVILPALLVAYVWLHTEHGERLRRSVLVVLPYAAVSAVYLAIRHAVIKPPPAGAGYIHPTFTHSYLWTAPYSAWWYLRHLVWPSGLAVEYDNLVLEQPTLWQFYLPAAALLLLAAGAWLLWRRWRSPPAAFLGVWLMLALAPPVAVAAMVREHDRYLFVASYAYCALLGWLLLRAGRMGARARQVLVLAVVLLFAGLSWHELGYWEDDLHLWQRAVQISPQLVKARYLYAFHLSENGEMDKAKAVLDEGLRQHPNSPTLWLQHAGFLNGEGRTGEALAAYQRYLQITAPPPGQPEAAGDAGRLRANVAFQMAKMEVKAGHFTEAEQYARMALALDPNGAGYHYMLGEALRGEGHEDEAKAENVIELRLRLRLAKH